MKNFRLNKKGFTLIELMIVIAIIGVLAAIAIPNFIAYRNRSFCASTENTARNVAAAVAEYYSVPTRTASVPAKTDLNFDQGAIDQYGVTLTTNSSNGIIITATDPTNRCPSDYQKASQKNTTNKWNGSGVYTYNMQ